MSHANACLTVRGRLVIVERARWGWPQAHIAAAMGVSRRCVKRWLDRYRIEGETGLHDRSSRPHHVANRTAEPVVAAVVTLRKKRRGSVATNSPPAPGCRLGRCLGSSPAPACPAWQSWIR